MSRPALNAEIRTEFGKNVSRRLRAAGRIPAVVYGKGKSPVTVTVCPKEVLSILEGEKGRNTPLDLQVTDEKSPRLALVKSYQVHPWKRTLRHVDFWEIAPDMLVTVPVPFSRTGESPLEKLGGQATFHAKTIQVRCKPSDIPASILVDFGKFGETDHSLAVDELELPDGIEVVTPSEFKVLHIKFPKAEVVEEEEDEEAEGGEEAEEGDGDQAS